ncbi:MAG TPA: homocysteine S-methyltransferase family protein, partial [Atribacteraceae bacterium]|nr:homocysteine S-methyltransferase family protein [Atribacteraceae bacterium]
MILNDLLTQRTILFDGAMGTRLQTLGLPPGHPPEEWNLSHPAEVFQVHQEYVDGGSQIIETNTFGANRIRLKRYALASRIRDLNQEGAHLAREAAGDRVIPAASLGPTGEFLEPYGDLTPEVVLDTYREQVQILRESGIELFHLETFSYSGEALLACQAVREAGGEVIASF